MTQPQTAVDVGFPLKGDSLPLDHGYLLFAAASKALPRLHQEPKWGLHPVHGLRVGPGLLKLLPSSLLTLRLPASEIGAVLPLTGSVLEVGGARLTVGIPRVFPLKPGANIHSRIVTIKSFKDDEKAFEGAVRRQLATLGISASATIVIGPRRVVRVARHTIVGFPVALGSLATDESVRVQTEGLGGRRHMGAGLFLSAKRTQ